MKRIKSGVLRSCAAILLLAVSGVSSLGQESPTGSVWNYVLLPGSELVDACPVCGRPDIIVPLRGGFQLRLIEENPLLSSYSVEGLSCAGVTPGGARYTVAGKGTHLIGGEVVVLQEMFLEAQVDNGFTNAQCFFTNDSRAVTRLWPMMEIGVSQTNGTILQQFHLKLVAAPLREIWFSTLNSFHNGLWQPPTNYVSAGDLLASSGRIVRRNEVLTRNLGVMPVVPDLGLKDVDILPGGEVAFSIEQDVFSESLGLLQTGDLLSDCGRIIATNGRLIAAFAPRPPVADTGLGAVQVLDSGEVHFSVQTNFYSQALQREVKHGDLLSSRGVIVRSAESLIARFQPADPKSDCGLRSAYVWPSGEVWFSTETGFFDTSSNLYAPGDLLSDQGYIVYRNLDLLGPFAPIEDLSNFGLDALFIVTDVTPSPPAPLCVEVGVPQGTIDVRLRYKSEARVFQAEKSANVAGPWMPLSPIGPDLDFSDIGALQSEPQSFYRLRAW